MNAKFLARRAIAVLLFSITSLVSGPIQAATVADATATLDWTLLSTGAGTATIAMVAPFTLFINSATTLDLGLGTIATDTTVGGPAMASGIGTTVASASGGPGPATASSDTELGGAITQHLGTMTFFVSAPGSVTISIPYTLAADAVAGPFGSTATSTASLAFLHFPVGSGIGSGSSDIKTAFSASGGAPAATGGLLTISIPAVVFGDVIRIDALAQTNAFVAIPVPASLPLLMGALVGLGAIARRRPA